jgi:hypothetical protein
MKNVCIFDDLFEAIKNNNRHETLKLFKLCVRANTNLDKLAQRLQNKFDKELIFIDDIRNYLANFICRARMYK